MRIVAATDFSTRSNRALRQAGLLAQASGARLDLVHVVDDDQPERLVALERSEAERLLVEQIGAMPELNGVKCFPVVMAGSPFDGILRAAEQAKADLVVLGAHRRQLLRDIFTGTTIERVVRLGSFPVLMVNNEAQRRYDKIVAAVDMSEMSANSLRVAISTGLVGDFGATLLHAFIPPAKGKLSLANASQSRIDEYVEEERAHVTDELAAFLAQNQLAQRRWSLRVVEGFPMEVISRSVEQLRSDLLIVATHGRSGLVRALIGSVTETALRTLNVDILAVPPVKGAQS